MTPLIIQLRTLAVSQPGYYITGETLKRHDRPDEYLVISTWRSIQDWNAWVNSDARKEIQTKIDTLTGGSSEYTVYEPISGS